MAGVEVQSGSQLAERIQSAAQQKLMDLGWAPEESDTTLSEYVTMMLVNGKDAQGVRAELGGELLGVGEEDAGVGEFTDWLFQQVHAMSGGGAQQEQDPGATTMEPQMQTDDAEDQAMGDAAPVDGAYVSPSSGHDAAGFSFKGAAGIVDPLAHRLTATNSPTGPRSMRNGSDSRGRGRGGRMLGQLNRNMDRSQDDPLRKIKGAANRIDAHSGRTPRGPRGSNVANGLQRAMNGGRGGHQGMAQMNMMSNGPVPNLDPQNQMAFMQMMQMQAEMMQQMFANGGQMPNQGGFQKGGRGGKPLFDRMEGKRGGRGGRQQSHAGSQNGDAASTGGMDLDKPLTDISKPKFDTVCKFNMYCTNPNCEFAHQSPANKNPNIMVDTSDTCSYGIKCQNFKCIARHPSPAKRQQFHNAGYTAGKSDVECRFYPNCTNGSACPFKHPDVPACRNGADCQDANCTFAHSSIMCRYPQCTKPACPFKHTEGQRGTYKDKIWTAEGGEPANGDKTDRFAELAGTDGQGAEVILPGQQENGDGANGMSDMKPENEDVVT